MIKLLFITQKLHGQDAFGVLWAKAFADRGYKVIIICLEWRPDEMKSVLGNAPFELTVYSLGKELGTSKFSQVFTFLKLICTLKYDRVFIHMAPVWGLFGAPVWIVRRIPVYLWYTHYKMQMGLRLLGWYGKRLFCATPQSLPQYEGSPKKVVVGHGIDLDFWPKRENICTDPRKLLMVHRLSRSKRLELVIHAMELLPYFYTLDIYGIEAEPNYVLSMRSLVEELKLSDRIHFHGTVPVKDLQNVYASHRLILNMAKETIDKTMLEAMTCGCYPVTTERNAKAIGIPTAPAEDSAEAIAHFVERYTSALPISNDAMYEIVSSRHSLTTLMKEMDSYIRYGV